MLIYGAMQSGERRAAAEWATKLRGFQDVLHTAAYGDASREWTHLPLVQVSSASNTFCSIDKVRL